MHKPNDTGLCILSYPEDTFLKKYPQEYFMLHKSVLQ